jgi:copper(I)-binding protein
MERLEAVDLAAGETRLAPGGTHLMLFGTRALAPGEHVVLRLELDGGELREVKAEVRPAGGGHAHHEP